MCNDCEQHIAWAEYCRMMQSLALDIPINDPAVNNRQIVVLRPEDWAAWIHLTKPETELLTALPAGSLAVETVREGRG
jgi:hypothetical protein